MNMEVKYNSSDKVNHNSVGAIIINEKGEILVKDYIKYNFITLPIGKADLNKDQAEELKREIKEETNNGTNTSWMTQLFIRWYTDNKDKNEVLIKNR